MHATRNHLRIKSSHMRVLFIICFQTRAFVTDSMCVRVSFLILTDALQDLPASVIDLNLAVHSNDTVTIVVINSCLTWPAS